MKNHGVQAEHLNFARSYSVPYVNYDVIVMKNSRAQMPNSLLQKEIVEDLEHRSWYGNIGGGCSILRLVRRREKCRRPVCVFAWVVGSYCRDDRGGEKAHHMTRSIQGEKTPKEMKHKKFIVIMCCGGGRLAWCLFLA